ncbi:hypothetical protein [Merismopedia glauca]|uniref:Uncharacterized protein n=1 Tax=Merismopedia glauca CCAP 1448/3 TaxID=1296344 RepID=A0A2T1C601_9CYAN|nr:hypothetical protein [Merismopedia glauca]PSB03689.1 hypothetical protein C7B64_07160 [Merismopedia glauca CCAP 1448/3]
MNLDQQIQELIDNAPEDDLTTQGIMAIAPVLKLLASRFKHETYFVWQNFQQQWVLTTLAHQTKPNLSKQVIYTFASAGDAASSNTSPGSPQSIPIISLLFQLIAMESVDSLVIFDRPGDLMSGTEIARQDLQNLIHTQLQQLYPSGGDIPSDLA